MKLLFSDETRDFADHYRQTLPHALLLSGAHGVGLATLANHLAESSGRLLHIVEPVKKTKTSVPSIGVEQIRQLYNEARTTLDGAHFIIIDDAETMNITAQNALLKLLEEPNESIHFILTSHQPDGLLPTIISRLQVQVINPINSATSTRLVRTLDVTDEKQRNQLLYIASGLPAELTRLASNPAVFSQLVESVSMSRQFIQGSTYQRLALIDGLKEDRSQALSFIDMTTLILRRSLNKSDDRATIQLIDKLLSAHQSIKANGNIRLQLTASVV